jgi:hypothetical protein
MLHVSFLVRLAFFSLAWLLACAQAHAPEETGPPPRATRLDAVDVLLVIENGGIGVHEELASLYRDVPELARVLASGDADSDGVPEHLGVHARFGTVSTDMGSGGFRVPTCIEPMHGDDAVLDTGFPEMWSPVEGCPAEYAPFLDIAPSAEPEPDAVRQLQCRMLGHGADQCGYEQHLESMLKAVTPSGSPLRFHDDSLGQADRANAGFLRDDALIAVIDFAMSDDFSAEDPDLYNPSSETYEGTLLNRPREYPEALHSVRRYVDGLIAAGDGDSSRVFYSVVAGVPLGAVDGRAPDYPSILAHPEMQDRLDPSATFPQYLPSCNVAGRGWAFPPRRLVEVGMLLDARDASTWVESVCQADLAPAFRRIGAAILEAVEPR